MEHLRCVIERITFQNPENGCTVIKCRAKGFSDLVTVVGNMPDVHVGSVLFLEGSWQQIRIHRNPVFRRELSNTMRIYMIRHGQTGRNKAFLLQGRTDDQLNEKGIEQAQEASGLFKSAGIIFDKVYTSPLKRAIQTAEIISDRVPIIDERLIEMDYGPYEGTDLTNLPPELKFFFSDFVHNPAPEGMESLESVVKRAGEFLEDLKTFADVNSILISTHAIAMKGLLEYLTPESNGSYWSKHLDNCEIYTTSLLSDRTYDIPRRL